MVFSDDNKNYIQALPGVQRKALAAGRKSLMVKFLLEAGSEVPMHDHHNEQIGYMIAGEMIMTIDGNEYMIKSGDSWVVNGGSVHGVKAIKDSEVVEVFVPVREDYLD